MGVLFTVISPRVSRMGFCATTVSVAHGTGLVSVCSCCIAANGVGLVIKKPTDGLPASWGFLPRLY